MHRELVVLLVGASEQIFGLQGPSIVVSVPLHFPSVPINPSQVEMVPL